MLPIYSLSICLSISLFAKFVFPCKCKFDQLHTHSIYIYIHTYICIYIYYTCILMHGIHSALHSLEHLAQHGACIGICVEIGLSDFFNISLLISFCWSISNLWNVVFGNSVGGPRTASRRAAHGRDSRSHRGHVALVEYLDDMRTKTCGSFSFLCPNVSNPNFPTVFFGNSWICLTLSLLISREVPHKSFR